MNANNEKSVQSLAKQIQSRMIYEKLYQTEDNERTVPIIQEVILDNMSQEFFRRSEIGSLLNSIEVICDYIDEIMSKEEQSKFYQTKLEDMINSYNAYHSTQVMILGVNEELVEPQLTKGKDIIYLTIGPTENRKNDFIYFFYEMASIGKVDKIGTEK